MKNKPLKKGAMISFILSLSLMICSNTVVADWSAMSSGTTDYFFGVWDI